MATVNLTPAPGGSNYPDLTGITKDYWKYKRVSLAEYYAKKGSNLAASDVLEAITVTAGEKVLGAMVRIVTPSTAAMTATFGDATDPDGYLPTITLNSAAGTEFAAPGAYFQSGTTPFAITQGKTYAAADTLDFVLGGTASNDGVIDVLVNCIAWNN
jgi:hypothetical protein